MKLYKVTIKNYNSYYVIAEDETSAYKKLRKILDDEDLCFTSDRKLKCIELVAEALYETAVFFENN